MCCSLCSLACSNSDGSPSGGAGVEGIGSDHGAERTHGIPSEATSSAADDATPDAGKMLVLSCGFFSVLRAGCTGRGLILVHEPPLALKVAAVQSQF